MTLERLNELVNETYILVSNYTSTVQDIIICTGWATKHFFWYMSVLCCEMCVIFAIFVYLHITFIE